MKMKNGFSVAGFTAIGLLFLASSCSEDQLEQVEMTGVDQQENNRFLTGEERAIKAFQMFVDNLDDKASTRAAKDIKVAGVKKKTTDDYKGASSATRTLGTAMPVYELTLQNSDETSGFAVVTESEPELCELMAYAPVGAISDTVYNKGLAQFFRDLVTCSDAMMENADKERSTFTSWGDVWQPYSMSASFFRVDRSYEFVRNLTQSEIDNGAPGFPYSEIYHWVTAGDIIPAVWNQTAPYNNNIDYYATGTSKKLRIGCIPVACGQIMSYYKKPLSYNWDLLTASPSIANNTSAATEVARLLYDLYKKGHIRPIPDKNQSSGDRHSVESILRDMEYDFAYRRDYTLLGDNECFDSIYNNVKFNHPVVMIGEEPDQHAWVIDAVIDQKWWNYTAEEIHSNTLPYVRFEVRRQRYAGHFYHCNWGWGGHSNGWYFMFIPEFTDGKKVNFDVQKAVITQIKPK